MEVAWLCRQPPHVSLDLALFDSRADIIYSIPIGAEMHRFGLHIVGQHCGYHKFDTNYRMSSDDHVLIVGLDSTIDCLW